MDGFKRDYQRLFELFQEQSRIGTTTSPCEDTGDRTESSRAPSQQGVPSNCKAYNFTFCQFLHSFQQLKFSAIFCCHRTNSSLHEFFDQICEFLLEKISSNQPIETRIFAFYLLYALWFIQSRSYKLSFRIRLDRHSYSILQDLINYASRQQLFDMVLAYRALLFADAFAFCHSTPLYGPYFKDYLRNKPLASFQEISNTNLKHNQSEYFVKLENIGKNENSIECDKLVNLVKKFEDIE